MEPVYSQEELARQVQLHLQSLRRAGVEWIPNGPALAWKTPAPRSDAGEQEARRPATPLPASPSPVLPPSPASPVPVSVSPLVLPPSAQLFDIPAAVDPVASMTLEERRHALQVLADEVKKCTSCAELCSTRTQTVFGSGQPGVELCFVGEAPGGEEDAQGLPFVGPAGQLLTRIIEASGFKRDEVYICNILKCRPPGNRTPLPNEAGNCREYLEKQLSLVRPKFICALGGCAAANLLGTTLSIARLRGRFHDYKGIPVLVTYHPAYLLPHKHPEMKKEVWDDMKFLLTGMGRPIPKKGAG